MEAGPDIVIIGSGMGGATLAASLAPTGRRIVILERGEQLQASPECRDPEAIFGRGVFRPDEQWLTPAGQSFNPGNYYYVGGNSRFYGAVMLRYRAEDFKEMQHLGGTSPAWPMLRYDDFEPWYQAAEELYEVRGRLGEDPSEPEHSGNYAFEAVPDEATIADARRRLAAAGVHPCALPLAVDIDGWLAGGQTPWDAFPDTAGSKKDAESVGIASALKHANVELITGAPVTRLIAGPDGRIETVEYNKDGDRRRIHAGMVVLSAGAVNSAVLLLNSASDGHPNGLANSSDMVGRHFMNHNSSALLAIHPFRRNSAVYQKTLQFNDYYLSGGPGGAPLGNIQLLGKISGPILSSQTALPGPIANWIAGHAIDWYAMSEDLPDPESRVMVKDGRIILNWKQSNWEAHAALVKKTRQLLKRAGFPIVLSRAFDRRTPSHQCGTARFGTDPKNSVLDLFCRAHDHSNLFVVDASFLPNSAAVNPALTVAAQALRVADHIKNKDLAT